MKTGLINEALIVTGGLADSVTVVQVIMKVI